jgi:hypothetical protein
VTIVVKLSEGFLLDPCRFQQDFPDNVIVLLTESSNEFSLGWRLEVLPGNHFGRQLDGVGFVDPFLG